MDTPNDGILMFNSHGRTNLEFCTIPADLAYGCVENRAGTPARAVGGRVYRVSSIPKDFPLWIGPFPGTGFVNATVAEPVERLSHDSKISVRIERKPSLVEIRVQDLSFLKKYVNNLPATELRFSQFQRTAPRSRKRKSSDVSNTTVTVYKKVRASEVDVGKECPVCCNESSTLQKWARLDCGKIICEECYRRCNTCPFCRGVKRPTEERLEFV